MSPVVRCADTDAAQRRRKIRVQLIDREIRLDIRPPRRKVKSVAGTTRLGEILCGCRFLSTTFRKWIKLKFFSLLTQIYINTIEGSLGARMFVSRLALRSDGDWRADFVDDSGRWPSLQLNLPMTPIHELSIRGERSGSCDAWFE